MKFNAKQFALCMLTLAVVDAVLASAGCLNLFTGCVVGFLAGMAFPYLEWK